jgi:hypothetical protein
MGTAHEPLMPTYAAQLGSMASPSYALLKRALGTDDLSSVPALVGLIPLTPELLVLPTPHTSSRSSTTPPAMKKVQGKVVRICQSIDLQSYAMP